MPTKTTSSKSMSLLNLAKHQQAYIDCIACNRDLGVMDSVLSKRLQDLGFLPNTPIKVVATGLFGRPPFAVQLGGGAQFSLRRDELDKIRCRLP